MVPEARSRTDVLIVPGAAMGGDRWNAVVPRARGPTLLAMHEDQLLQAIARASAGLTRWPGVVVGPGDDTAVLDIPGPLLITNDQLIEGRHIEPPGHAAGPSTAPRSDTTPPDDAWLDRVARKAMARSVSDIAAMAGQPVAAVATAALPSARGWDDETARRLFACMNRWAEFWGCPLVGGDIATTPGPLLLTTTVLGTPHPLRGPVLRSAARPGDTVWVTGALGGSLASGHHWSFTPRLHEAAALADALDDRLHAMMDLSDGLGLDSARLARASGVAIELDSALLPRNPGVDADGGWAGALGDGEDYELLLTVDASVDDHSVRRALAGLARDGESATPITRVGVVRASAEHAPLVTIIDHNGAAHPVEGLGWVHR
jgi:thiamine-monophosphate kinase